MILAPLYWQHRISDGTNASAVSLTEIVHTYSDNGGVMLDPLEYFSYHSVEREESQVEEELCSDFICCGFTLPDLHALLHHYEESHVRMEDELGYDGHRIMEMQMIDEDRLSAFDMTVFRTVTPAQAFQYQNYQPAKRPKSTLINLASSPTAITTLQTMLSPVLANISENNSLQLIHTALSSTINPPKTPINSSRSKDSETVEARKRPYACRVEGCEKTYKNPNGLKYHMIHGHDREGKDSGEKPHRCPYPNCSKRYKNANGLKYHVHHGHTGQIPPYRRTISSLERISGLSQIEAALKREQALRAQLANQK